MKKFLKIIGLTVLGVIGGITLWLTCLYINYKHCLKPTSVQQGVSCLESVLMYEPQIRLVNTFVHQEKLGQVLDLIDKFKPLLPYRDYLLGLSQGKPTTYLVLLQNDNELRTNGGFFGSYAVASTQFGHIDIRFQDIYVPDGQLPGHVDPPQPIQEAFKQGWFKLRDSDWKADFPADAETIRWFFENGNEINPDLLITLNLDTIRKIMDVVGPFEVPEFKTTITPDNIYILLQNKAEIGFFPGSTQKKDALSATGKAFVNHLKNLKPQQYLQILSILTDQLDKQNILINSQSSDFQEDLDKLGWTGKFEPTTCPSQYKDNCIDDSLSIIETNLGTNKANCCIVRSTIHKIEQTNNQIQHDILINFNNQSPVENPVQPFFYGGNYIDFIRFYIPLDASNVNIKTNPTFPSTLSEYPTPYQPGKAGNIFNGVNFGFQEIGFFHTTKANSQSQIELTYSIPHRGENFYQLSLQKQHGLAKSPQTIYLFGEPLTSNLETNYTKLIPILK